MFFILFHFRNTIVARCYNYFICFLSTIIFIEILPIFWGSLKFLAVLLNNILAPTVTYNSPLNVDQFLGQPSEVCYLENSSEGVFLPSKSYSRTHPEVFSELFGGAFT